MSYKRKVGPWNLEAGEATGYVQRWNEDGPLTQAVQYLLVQAVHDHGAVYNCVREFDNQEQAEYYMDNLDGTFDADVHPHFAFDRNIYGSDAYQANWHEEEYSRMEEGERERYVR